MLIVLEIQGYSTGLMMSQLQEGRAVYVEIPFCKRIPKRLGPYISLQDLHTGLISTVWPRVCWFFLRGRQ